MNSQGTLDRNRFSRSIAMAAGLAIAAAATVAMSGPGDVAKDGADKIWKAVGKKLGIPTQSIFGRHAPIDPVEINGKLAYIIDLRNEDGSRCSNNFSQTWDGPGREFKVHVIGVDTPMRMAMSWQRKGDKKVTDNVFANDSNRGPQFKHGSTITLDGSYNYLAQRNFEWTDALEDQYQWAGVVLLEEGLSYQELVEYFENNTD